MIKIGRYEIDNSRVKEVKYKWVAWQSASFAQCAEWYKQTKFKDNPYKEGADKTFAVMAMTHFKELWELDKTCAEMVGSTWEYTISEMMDTLGDDGKKYQKAFTF